MRTRATFDKETQTFVIHSPDFEAAKCWVGLSGQHATHAAVYAQLYTPDGVCHGLHTFAIQIRDLTSLVPLPGVIIADMGPKGGMNGVDNGYDTNLHEYLNNLLYLLLWFSVIMFNQHRVPKSALLNRHANVSQDGVYLPKLKDPKKLFNSSHHSLSMGRINITCICSAMIAKCVTIGIRYAAVRKQFGPEDCTRAEEELPILEYQLHVNIFININNSNT